MDFSEGSEVITPACTFGTTVGPIIMKNLVPVLVDSKLGSYNLDLDKVESCITFKTVAIMVPHAVGSINDMVRLREICDKYRLKLIEDSCDTQGARFMGKPTGVWSDITTTSFYASHNMTAGGGGGMLMTDDPEIKRRAKIFRDWGRALPERYEHYEGAFEERYNFKLDDIDYDGKFVFMELGYNLKAVEMQAAFGLVQLQRLPEFNRRRSQNFDKLFRFFRKYEKFFILPEILPGAESYWLSFPITVREESGIARKELLKFFETNKIQTRLLFAGNILRHPAYKKLRGKVRVATSLENADYVMKNTFLVACHHGLDDAMIDYLTSKIEEFLVKKGLLYSVGSLEELNSAGSPFINK
jgi:CDP-6-deoxy-D-xylo-4-hexulose-3-dehydrase